MAARFPLTCRDRTPAWCGGRPAHKTTDPVGISRSAAHEAQILNRQQGEIDRSSQRTEGDEAAVGGEAVDVLAAELRRRDRRPAALGRPREGGSPELPQLLEEGRRDGQVRVVPEPHREDRVYPLGLRCGGGPHEEIKHTFVALRSI